MFGSSTCHRVYYSFSDRDIMMRYHWGMGVGHDHAHGLADIHAEHSDLDCNRILEQQRQQQEGEAQELISIDRDSTGKES